MNSKRLYFITLVSLLVILGACAPKAVPTMAPAPAAPMPVQASPNLATPTVSPNEANWVRVIEAAKKEGKLTAYTFSMFGDIGTAVAAGFEKRYGIKVELVTGVGAGLMERIKIERAARRYIADTLDSAGSLMLMAKQEGLTQSFGPLPSLEEKDIWNTLPQMEPEVHLLGIRSTVYSPYINTRFVKAEETPKSYRDLLAPQWRKRMVVPSPVTAPTIIQLYLATLQARALDENYWRQLAGQELQVVPTIREVINKLVQGEAHLAVVHADSQMASFVREGAPIKAIDMEEGKVVIPHGTAITMVSNAPHPNAAKLFANWLLSQEGHSIYSQAVGGFLPLRKDVADVRPSAVKTLTDRVMIVDGPMQIKATQMQQEGTLARLLGIGK